MARGLSKPSGTSRSKFGVRVEISFAALEPRDDISTLTPNFDRANSRFQSRNAPTKLSCGPRIVGTMKITLVTPQTPAFGRRPAWRERFLAIGQAAGNAPAPAFQPSVSPFRRIPLAGPRPRP